MSPYFSGKMSAQAVDRAAGAVEDAAQNLRGQGQLHGVPGQTGAGVVQGNAVGAFKDLDDHPFAVDLDHTARARTVPSSKRMLHHLLKGGVLHVVQHDQGTVDFLHAQYIQ